MSSPLQPSAHAELVDLLQSCFEAEELRRFAEGLSDQLRHYLPGTIASMNTLTHAAIRQFEDRGLLLEVFGALRVARPHRKDDIDKVTKLAAQDLESSSTDPWPLMRNRTLWKGRFTLQERIGGGGFGEVWSAIDHTDRSEVAIKFLRGPAARFDEKQRLQFFRGAEEMQRVKHPAIVEVVEPRCEEGGLSYYVMARIRGVTLAKALEQREIQPADIPRLTVQIGEGLAAAHRLGLVHDDINPKNILLDESRAPKIVDFDFTRKVELNEFTTTYAGTRYSAPEAYDPAKIVGVQADIFSLAMVAVVMYNDGHDIPQDKYNHNALRALIHRLPCAPPLRYELARATGWGTNGRHPTMDAFCRALERATKRRWLLLWTGALVLQRNTHAFLAIAAVAALLVVYSTYHVMNSLACPVTSEVFAESDSIKTYVVPEYCSVVRVHAWGGGGGGALLDGGGGGFAGADFRVHPGDVLTVSVGGGGGSWAVGGFAKNTGGAFGGRGGFAGASSGGYSAIREHDEWLLVAGGGGGAGATGPGGGGGGKDGEKGGPDNTLQGQGGSHNAPGAEGVSLNNADNGQPGNGMTGGAGGGHQSAKQGDSSAGIGGGGGGGGWWAGGGGGGDTENLFVHRLEDGVVKLVRGPAHSGGGGGGSGYIDTNRALEGTAELLGAQGAQVPRNSDSQYRNDAGRGGAARPRPESARVEATGGKPGLVVISTSPHITSLWPNWD